MRMRLARGTQTARPELCDKAKAVRAFRESKALKKRKPMEECMLNEPSKRKAATEMRARWPIPFVSAALLTMVATNTFAEGERRHSDFRFTRYVQTNLVSDLPGVAMLRDTNLVNAWGVSFTPTSPFWVSAN